MMLFFSVLMGAALSQSPEQIRTANKIKAGFVCENFKIKFTVTKRQLYKSVAMPKSNIFKIGIGNNCKRTLTQKTIGDPLTGDTWVERQRTEEMDFFTENELEKCGSTMIQDEFGIVYELHVKGRRSRQSPPPYQEQTLIFSCFYPLADTPYDDLPQDLKKYITGDYVIGTASMQFRQYGNLTADFSLYDIQANSTGDYYPYKDAAGDYKDSQHKSVGGAVIVGVVPKAEWVGGINTNHFFQHPARWDYFLRDCIYSGVLNETQRDIQLIKRNCKTKKYHVQQLTKFGRKTDGHMIMFEAIAFEDAEDHYLTCDVDICLKTREGDHSWPGCYQQCNDPQFISQTIEENEFELTTTTAKPVLTAETTTTEPAVTANPPLTFMPETYATTQTIGEPLDDLLAAKDICVENFLNDHFYDGETELFLLCQYIRVRFPDEFE